MQALNQSQRVVSKSSIVILFSLIFIFFASPVVFAQEQESIDALRQMGKAFSGIAEKASAAVVGLETQKTVTRERSQFRDWPFGDSFGDDFFDKFFRRDRSPRQRRPEPAPRKYRQMAQGSGFIISPDGYILTNNHLVEEADEDGLKVKLADGREFEAKLIGTDPESDVAVIKIDANDLPILKLADSDKLEVGEWVLAIGNPFGLAHTVTAGIVSAKGRSRVGIANFEDFIQTDAAINPGNSGGPLINLDCEVVGINTAIVSRGGGNMGIGFAIPVNMARSIYEQLAESGTVVRGFLGVNIQPLTADLAKSFGMDDSKGALISEVVEDSAAEKAGLKAGDIVVKLEGKVVEDADDLRNRIAMFKPGTEVEMLVLREGKNKKITAELSERPAEGVLAAGQSEAMKDLGLAVENLSDELAERLGYEGESGVVVSDVESGSAAEAAGISKGALIAEVNREVVKNVKDFKEKMEGAAENGSVLLLLKYKGYTRYVVLKIPKKK